MDFRGGGREGFGTRAGVYRALSVLTLLAAVLSATAAPASAASNGAVAWGGNLYRQLGDGGSETYRDTPVAVSGLSGVSAVSAGARHSLALLSSGTVMAWGDDEDGQLGNGMSESLSDVPVAVKGLSGVVAISAGANHSLALLSNGTVMAWGENESGQLGNGSLKESNVPVAVKGLSGVSAISAGGEHSLALLKTGAVMSWGNNDYGQLGTGGTKQSDVPVAVKGLSGVSAISAGGEHSLALLKTGTVMAWGDNESGQLGKDLGEEEEAVPFSGVPAAVHGLSGVSAISAGASYSLALLKAGTAMGWGEDTLGQLGNGSTASAVEAATPVSGLSGASTIVAGGEHSVALLGNGTAMAWGGNEWGILGDGSDGGYSDVPVSVSGVSGLKGVAAGAMHSVAYGEPIPTVTSVSPESGGAGGGTSVTLNGLEFTGATAVRFGSANATSFTVSSSTTITAVAPAGTGTVSITVSTPAGTSPVSRSARFTYLPPPVVTKLSPTSGAVTGATTVTITGSNLSGTTAVTFGSTPASSVTVNSATSITALAPALSTAETVNVTVSTPDGTSTVVSADRFKFTPVVSGVSPQEGSKKGGTSVTVHGAGFATGAGATEFKFGSANAKSVECGSSDECTMLAPAHGEATVDVTATVNKLLSVKEPPGDQFTFTG